MDPCNIAPYDSSAPSEGAIELLLEQGALSLPMVGVAKGLIAAECASDLLLRTLSGSSASSSGTDDKTFWGLGGSLYDGDISYGLWDDLPQDLWQVIFRHAGLLGPSGVKMRCMLSTKCSAWRRILSSTAFWKEIELITADFKDAEHFVHALLMCCQPCHKVERIRIAQSPLIAERPWERAHRILYDSPSHNQLFDPAQSPAGLANLELFIKKAYERATAAGSPLPSQDDPVWSPVYRQLIHVMQGRMYRLPPEQEPTGWTAFRKAMKGKLQHLTATQRIAIFIIALGLLCVVPSVRVVLLWTVVMWILTAGVHFCMDLAVSMQANQSLPKIL